MTHLNSAFGQLMKARAEGREREMDQFVQLREKVSSFYRPGMTFLDVGCGMGHALRSLRQMDPEIAYRGVDIDEGKLGLARECFPGVEFRTGDVERLEGVAPAEAVLCYMLLLHLENYEKALESLARVCRRHLLVRTLLAPEEYRIERYRKDGIKFWYNMYEEDRFVRSLRSLGFASVSVEDSPLRHEIPYQDEWSTWTLQGRQVFGQLLLPWKIVHAERKEGSAC